MPLTTPSPDLLRRFTPTPLSAKFLWKNSMLGLETNSAALLQRMHDAIELCDAGSATQPAFFWRIVVEPRAETDSGSLGVSGFLDEHLCFVNIGHQSFLAVDLGRREGVAFLVEELTSPSAFAGIVRDPLLDLTSRALGIVTG